MRSGCDSIGSESARVQPFKCPQQIMLATRKLPLQPLLSRKRRKPFRRGLPCLGANIHRRGPTGRSPLSLRSRSPLPVPFPRRPNLITVSQSLRPLSEETAAAGSESARVQPFRCSQQIMLATRKLPLQPLFSLSLSLSRHLRKRGNPSCSLSPQKPRRLRRSELDLA